MTDGRDENDDPSVGSDPGPIDRDDDRSPQGDDSDAIDGVEGEDSDTIDDVEGTEPESTVATGDDTPAFSSEKSDEQLAEETDERPSIDGDRPRFYGPEPVPERQGRERDDAGPDPRSSPIRWAFRTDNELVIFLRDVLSSVATVLVVAALLFAISGIWPPLVAVESGSMEPHMYRGDLVFLMDEHRFPPDGAVAGTGVVTLRAGQETGYWSFGDHGNVVVYRPDGGGSTPIIHRARFYVEEGDNWVAEANEEYLGGVDTCAETMTCPAPHDGFITKGDHNGQYDQISGQSTVVKPSWIKGRAKVRIPWLGYVRLWLGSTATPTSLGTGGTPAVGGLVAGLIARLELVVAALGGMQVARTVR